ncbi:MAG: AAA family ATPase [Bacteroidia bacterium]|nr:AAA family ATPase [Bacteroidia bacterium]
MIDRIVIKGFKSIRELDLELRPVNVLIGANGAGKSNFIGFFELLQVLYRQSLQRFVKEHGSAENLLHFGLKKTRAIKGEIYFEHKNAYKFRLYATSNRDLFIGNEDSGFNRNGTNPLEPNWDFQPISSDQSESKLHTEKTANNWRDRNHYLVKYFDRFSIFHFHDTSATASIRGKCQVDDNKFLRSDGANLAAFLYYLKEVHWQSFKKIEMAITSVAPFFSHFTLEPDRLNPNFIQLEWAEKGSDMYFNATHLSDGTLRFIALATLLLQPDPPGTILIDEPELGLHPFAIHKLAGLVSQVSATNQVIISTQSPTLVDQFEPESIITVDRKDQQSVFQRHDQAELQGWLENYSLGEIWDKNIIGGRP